MSESRPFEELASSGLLWLLNVAVFHPRGFAFTLHAKGGEVSGWSLQGDGSEPWYFDGPRDGKFRAAEATFAAARVANRPLLDCGTCGGVGAVGDEGETCHACDGSGEPSPGG